MLNHYIIGDIHGEYKILLELIDKLPKDAKLIFVGDLIDRGLQSREIIEYIRAKNYQVVRGNHEQFMIEDGQKLIDKLLADQEVSMTNTWVFAGGIETLLSYGLLEKQEEVYLFVKNIEGITQLQDDIEWMKNLPLITKANVVKIDHNHKNSISITYRHKKEEIELVSDILISNLAPSATYKLANIEYSETKKVASSLLSIYIGFKSNLKSIYGKRAYSTFLLKDAQSMEDYDKSVQGDITDRGIVFVDYSQIDSGLTDASKSFGAICTTDYLSDWEGLEKEAYKQKKQEVLESYLNLLEAEYPNIREHIEFAEVGTAKTVQRYLLTPQGTAYGFAPTNQQFFRTPEVKSKKLNNLYFVGAWVIGGGFTPAILSGGLCYREIKL